MTSTCLFNRRLCPHDDQRAQSNKTLRKTSREMASTQWCSKKVLMLCTICSTAPCGLNSVWIHRSSCIDTLSCICICSRGISTCRRFFNLDIPSRYLYYIPISSSLFLVFFFPATIWRSKVLPDFILHDTKSSLLRSKLVHIRCVGSFENAASAKENTLRDLLTTS